MYESNTTDLRKEHQALCDSITPKMPGMECLAVCSKLLGLEKRMKAERMER